MLRHTNPDTRPGSSGGAALMVNSPATSKQARDNQRRDERRAGIMVSLRRRAVTGATSSLE
jgi:hypothetical protein